MSQDETKRCEGFAGENLTLDTLSNGGDASSIWSERCNVFSSQFDEWLQNHSRRDVPDMIGHPEQEQRQNRIQEQNNCTNWLWYAGLQRRMSPSPGSPRHWRRVQLYLPLFVCIRIKGSCQTTARSPSILGRPSLCTAPSVVAQAVRRM